MLTNLDLKNQKNPNFWQFWPFNQDFDLVTKMLTIMLPRNWKILTENNQKQLFLLNFDLKKQNFDIKIRKINIFILK